MSVAAARADASLPGLPAATCKDPKLDHAIHPGGVIAVLLVLVGGLGYGLSSLIADTNAVGQSPLAIGALALLIALAFAFVNGFHDIADAVATVIPTHSMPPPVAVIWSGTLRHVL